MVAELCGLQADEIFEEGLHEFLGRFIGEFAVLSGLVRDAYLSGDAR